MTASRPAPRRRSFAPQLVSFPLWCLAVTAGFSAWAQPPPGWSVVPSLTISGEYDSNVTGSASNPQSDFIGRATPSISTSYVGQRFSLSAGYSFDAEVYADRSDLNNVGDSQNAFLSGTYVLDPLTAVGLALNFALTGYSADFLQASPAAPPPPPQVSPPAGSAQAPPPVIETRPVGVDVGRQQSWILTVSPYATHQFTPSTSGGIGYTYTRTDVADGPSGSEHSLNLAVGHAFTTLDQGSLRYVLRVFPDAEGGDTEISHSALLGWARQLTRQTSARIEAGPHVQSSDVSLEVNAGLTHTFQRGWTGLTYTRSQTIVVGQAGAPIVDSVTAFIGYVPLRDLNVGLSASFSNIDEESGPSTQVYGATVTASYPLTTWAAASLSYQFSLEDTGSDHTDRHVVTLALTLAYPIRLR